LQVSGQASLGYIGRPCLKKRKRKEREKEGGKKRRRKEVKDRKRKRKEGRGERKKKGQCGKVGEHRPWNEKNLGSYHKSASCHLCPIPQGCEINHLLEPSSLI
jgi:hypothetical protein